MVLYILDEDGFLAADAVLELLLDLDLRLAQRPSSACRVVGADIASLGCVVGAWRISMVG